MLFRMSPAPYLYLGSSSGRDCRESIFGHLKQTTNVKRSSLSRSLSAHCRRVHGHGLMFVYHRCITTNGRTSRRRKVTFWWRNLCCVLFRYYLLNCENVIYLLMKVVIDENWNYLGILYVKAYILLVSTVVRPCVSAGI